MLDLVLDTNVIVAALRSKRGASYQLLQLIGTDTFRLHLSVSLALEYEDVLKRRNSVPQAAVQIDAFLDYVFSASAMHPLFVQHRPSLRDPADEHILELAIQSKAIIVTHNTKDFQGSSQFGVSIKTPAEILEEIRK